MDQSLVGIRSKAALTPRRLCFFFKLNCFSLNLIGIFCVLYDFSSFMLIFEFRAMTFAGLLLVVRYMFSKHAGLIEIDFLFRHRNLRHVSTV